MDLHVGIDISARRGCAIAAIDDAGRARQQMWSGSDAQQVRTHVRSLVDGDVRLLIGIDSPRRPLESPRPWYWNKDAGDWRPRRPTDRGWGRHCEVMIAALKLANPQWTPLSADAPAWMRLGFELFEILAPLGQVYEVFPSASYTQLDGAGTPRLDLSLAGFAEGKADMLDAYAGALTVREFSAGKGTEVGGGDGLGTIILPRRLSVGHSSRLFTWPSGRTANRPPHVSRGP